MEEIGAINLEKVDSFSSKDIEKRKKDIINFLKKKKDWIVYAILAFIISISVFIRTRPIPRLKDVTTGTWTLGPDLDPFLFLRWAKYIAEHGKLFIIDTMRYIPLADICSGEACIPVNTRGETILLPYLIAYLSKFLSFFDKDVTVTYAAIIFPVIFAALTALAFFLFARKLFYKERKNIANIIALIATAFFVLIPSLLPRTIAGIPEKESAAFFFIFMGLYFLLESFTSEKLKRGIIFAVLSGITTGALALIWGGIEYILITIAGVILLAFLFGKIDEKRFYLFGLWILGFILSTMPFSVRYSLQSLLTSLSTELIFMVFFIMLIDFVLFKKRLIKIPEKITNKLPHQIISLIIASILLVIVASAVFGISFIPDRISTIIDQTIQPLNRGRFSVTVAENKQPYFTSDWAGEFGPVVFNIPIYFWLFFAGAVFLFGYLIKPLNKKEKKILIISYIIFLSCLIFSKYAPHPNLLDGEGPLSLLVYFGGFLLFIGSFGYIYYKRYKNKEFSIFNDFNFAYILYFILLTVSIIGARGAIRFIMILGAVSPITIAFLLVKIPQKYFKEEEDTKKLFIGLICIILLISSAFTLWTYYNSDRAMAENYVPNFYTNQWQKAMAWVRESTPTNAVFAHWWDYGYWVQSIGERATILDGGNAIGYWNYFMGRHVLTGNNEREALDFLYAHKGTHLLIDSTDIGKYPAFSSIGSDANYDRYSWIPTIFVDSKQTQETKDGTIYVYPIGNALDEDIILNQEGTEILLPSGNTIVAAIAVQKNTQGEATQPIIFFVYNGKQYQEKLRYIFRDGELQDFNSGLDAGLFLFPQIELQNEGIKVLEDGAAFYLSKRVINSRLARLYLFNEKTNYFNLIHSEDNLIVEELKKQGVNIGEFVFYPGVGMQGPIKIWEINYPENMKINESFLSTDYPEELATVMPGGY